MSKNKLNLMVIAFCCFLALVIVATSVAIYNTPTEVVAGTAGNFSINLTNGGNVLEDDGFLFYTIPNKKGIYRVEKGKPETNKKISDIGDGNLQLVGSGYYFTDDDTLYRMDWDGNKRQVVLKDAINPKVVGSLVFYLDKESEIVKYSMKNDTKTMITTQTGGFDFDVKEFLPYYRKIYFVQDTVVVKKGFNQDPFEDGEYFFSADAKRLSIDGQYMFFIENGILKSVMMKDKQILKTDLMKAKTYAVYGNTCVYSDGKKTYFADINKFLSEDGYSPKVLADKGTKSISIDDENFYFFVDGVLKSVSHEGKNLKNVN